jgi:hypothetical protein
MAYFVGTEEAMKKIKYDLGFTATLKTLATGEPIAELRMNSQLKDLFQNQQS